MTARTFLAAAALLLVGLGATQAHATQVSETRRDVCLSFGGDGRLVPPQFCVVWDDAASE